MNGSPKFRVGLIQMRSARTPAANIDTAAKLIGEAKTGGAEAADIIKFVKDHDLVFNGF